jgi:hypothetical protein
MTATQEGNMPHRNQFALPLTALLAGCAAIVLSFTQQVSPWNATLDRDLWTLAMPFYLAVPIGLVSLRVVRGGAARRLGWVCALASGTVTTYSLLSTFDETAWLTVFVPVAVVLASGACFVAVLWWSRRRDVAPPLSAMMVVYASNACMCLVAFAWYWQAGAWCTTAVTLTYVAQMVALARNPAADPVVTHVSAAEAR